MLRRPRSFAERFAAVVVVVTAVVGLVLVVWYMLAQRQPQVAVGLGEKTFHVALVNTPSKLTKGLGGVEKLPEDGGMLFDFGRDDTWNIWMKDMKIPIDVLWLSRDGTVIHKVENMQPASYPKQYYPFKKARYVLELPAGASKQVGIKPGMRATLPDLAGESL